jgi:hypothetical protein
MTISAKLGRLRSAKLGHLRSLGVIGCAVLLGSATGLLGIQVGKASATASAAAPAGALSIPNPGSSRELNGDWCTSSSNCWAVGSHVSSTTGATLNEALHWNGATWSLISTPNPGGTGSGAKSELVDVSCTSAASCWAVGLSNIPGGGTLSEVLRWDGSKWSVVTTPDPAGTVSGDFNALTELSCTSATSCWAVGTDGTASSRGVALVNQAVKWDGTSWSEATIPNPAGTATGDSNSLTGISCPSATDCWAVGSYKQSGGTLNEVMHWNGTAWSQVSVPNPGGTAAGHFSVLGRVTCVSATNCWVVGGAGKSTAPLTIVNQALHWNGTEWRTISTPNPYGTVKGAINTLSDVTCTAANNCWAVGNYGSISNGKGDVANQVMRWDGTRWSMVSSPDPAGIGDGYGNYLVGISCASASNCWAVGNQYRSGKTPQNQVVHWNGVRWASG